MEFFNHLVSADFMPHGYCYLWDPWIVWLNVISDGLITLSYYCIPIVLIYFIHKRRDLPFNWIFWMFGGFILACGTTHLMEVWNIWHASYALAGVIKAITAIVSVATLIRLVPLLPQAIAVPTLIHLQKQNRSLEAQIAERKRLDDALVDAPLRRRVTAGIALAVLSIGFMGFLSWRSRRSAAAEGDLVAHTHAVMVALQTTLGNVVEAETSGRAFALSGNSALLAHYRAARGTVTRRVDGLRQMTADNPTQQQRIDLLEREISAALAFADGIVARREQTQAIPEASDILETERLLNAVQGEAQGIQAEESKLLSQRTQKTGTAQRVASFMIVSSTLAAATFLVLSGFAIHHAMDASAGARAQINILNGELEQRVEQRTAALQESQDRLTGILGSAMDSIITVDGGQRILLFNSAAEKMFRCPAAEALGQPITRFIPQRFHAAHTGHIKRFGEAGVTTRAMGALGALWAVRTDGEEFQIEASISQIESGSKRLFTVILRDVTERVRADAALKESLTTSERALKELADQKFALDQHAIVAVTDVQGTMTYVNDKFCAISKYSKDELIGQNHRILNSGHHPIEFFQQMYRTIANGEVWHAEIKNRAKDGSIYWVDTTIVPTLNAQGKPRQYVAIRADITERVRVEEARERLAAVVDSSDDAIISKTLDGTITAWNRGAEKLFGYSSSEAVGRPMRMLFPPELANEESDILARVRAGQSADHFETVRVRKDGKHIDVSVTISPIKDGSGAIAGASTIARDVTERKQADEALREKTQVLDSAQVFVRDIGSRVVFWPRGAEKLYGFTSQEALGVLSHDLFHTQFPEPLEAIEKQLFETGMWEGELIHRKRDGGVLVVSSAWVLHRNSQGQPSRILETNIDITARKRAEEKLAVQATELTRSEQALQTQTALLQSVLDSMGEGLVAADEHGEFTLWNSAAERILGLGAAKIPSREWTGHYGLFLSDTLTPFPPEQLPLARAIRGESNTAEVFVRNPTLVDSVWIEASGHPLKGADGTHHGGVVAFRDITQKKIAEQEIQKLNEALEQRVADRTAQLEAANQELESFTYTVAHDLRAPLRHIAGFSGILVEEFSPVLNAEAQRYLQRIQEGTQRMGRLVDELLTLAEVGRQPLNLQIAGLNSIVQEVIGMLQPDIEGRQVEWKIADLPFVECDPALLRQVFQNLISNADGSVMVKACLTGQDPDFVHIAVADTGRGISPEAKALIFERLYQDPNSIDDSRKGLGLGLYISKELVQLHGGKIWVESQLSHGSTFVFTLPLFSLAQFLAPVITTQGRLRDSLSLITIELTPLRTPFADNWEDLRQHCLQIMEPCILGDKDAILPALGHIGQSETLVVVASTDGPGAVVIERRMRGQLEASEKLKTSCAFKLSSIELKLPPADDQEPVDKLVQKVADSITEMVMATLSHASHPGSH